MFIASYGPYWARRTTASVPMPVIVLQTITFSDLPQQTILNTQYNQYGFTGFSSYPNGNYTVALSNFPRVRTHGGSNNPLIVNANSPPSTGLNNWMDNSNSGAPDGNIFGNAIDMNFDQSIYSVQSFYFDMAFNSVPVQVDLLDSNDNIVSTMNSLFGGNLQWNYNYGGTSSFPNIFSKIRFSTSPSGRMLIGNIRIEYLYYV